MEHDDNEMLVKLKKVLKETPIDEIKKKWDSGNYLDVVNVKFGYLVNPKNITC